MASIESIRHVIQRASRRLAWPLATLAIVLTALAVYSLGLPPRGHVPGHAVAPTPAGPPWIYGRPDARFTVTEYADLECPYCRAYFPVLKQWIDANPEVNWRWHDLPLPMHDPAATREARLTECAGETGGQAAFWSAVAWIYQHTRGDGQGVPTGMTYRSSTPALQQCMNSTRPDTVIHAEVEEAEHDGIAVTPSLHVLDHRSGKTLLLHGPAQGDLLLSAIDQLVASGKPADANAPSDPVSGAQSVSSTAGQRR
ncbi:DsbA family protein [Paraburkholderia ginsengisoli]|uniref:Thioredoxin domain-containing protein n=1 Tax=Paraburkholderia ginsengisoli TaxID=311231 RepID=A0A7T4N343_9BURK|nr:thioredoxin domain-containing protein [Paraburkholderia ginsengisoli]QQC64342.1 thioredoxin domain-containing protein [Paraburkholderia ginsengisoli]